MRKERVTVRATVGKAKQDERKKNKKGWARCEKDEAPFWLETEAHGLRLPPPCWLAVCKLLTYRHGPRFRATEEKKSATPVEQTDRRLSKECVTKWSRWGQAGQIGSWACCVCVCVWACGWSRNVVDPMYCEKKKMWGSRRGLAWRKEETGCWDGDTAASQPTEPASVRWIE